MSDPGVRTRRWRRVEYERAIDRGIFRDDERLELVEGVLVVREPQGDPHAATVDRVMIALRRAFGEGWLVRAHAPMVFGQWSRPEPDVSVVRGVPDDYDAAAPRQAALVVEVSESSLRFDRQGKAAMYARGGIAEYWIVNLVDEVLEVHRDPGAREYRSVERFGRRASVTPLAAAAARITVASLFRTV